jgi:hypothetical protein
VESDTPLPEGNTETFRASILPEILQFIATLGQMFPDAGLKIEKNLSFLIPEEKEPMEPELYRRVGSKG